MNQSSSRFAGLSPRAAQLVLVALLIALCASLFPAGQSRQSAPPPVASKATDSDPDILLYEAIVRRVAAGEDYYATAAEELRAGNYPLRPFITFRLPTLAWLNAGLGTTAAHGLLLVIGLGTLVSLHQALRRSGLDNARALAGTGLAVAGMTLLASSHYLTVHELWAGIMMLFSFAIHREGRWAASLFVAALALSVRELALPFVLLMGAFALYRCRWPEAMGWAALILAFIGIMALHADAVATVVQPNDPASPPWTEMGGWASSLNFLHATGPFRMFPSILAYPILILCMFGWLAWPSLKGAFGTLLLLGYSLAFMMFGRPNNFYWGLVIAPFLAIGLAFLRPALTDLFSRAARPQLDFTRD